MWLWSIYRYIVWVQNASQPSSLPAKTLLNPTPVLYKTVKILSLLAGTMASLSIVLWITVVVLNSYPSLCPYNHVYRSKLHLSGQFVIWEILWLLFCTVFKADRHQLVWGPHWKLFLQTQIFWLSSFLYWQLQNVSLEGQESTKTPPSLQE